MRALPFPDVHCCALCRFHAFVYLEAADAYPSVFTSASIVVLSTTSNYTKTNSDGQQLHVSIYETFLFQGKRCLFTKVQEARSPPLGRSTFPAGIRHHAECHLMYLFRLPSLHRGALCLAPALRHPHYANTARNGLVLLAPSVAPATLSARKHHLTPPAPSQSSHEETETHSVRTVVPPSAICP